MPDYLLILDGAVENVVHVDDSTPHGWLDQLVKDRGYERAVDRATIDGPVGPGYLFRRGRGYVPPVELVADPPIVTHGGDSTVVTYRDNRPDPPAEVPVVIGDAAPSTLKLTGGVGTLTVHVPGSQRVVIVTAGDATLGIGVAEPPA